MSIVPTTPNHVGYPHPSIVTSWVTNVAYFDNLADRLLDNSILNSFALLFQKPIENIMSVRVYPFDVLSVCNLDPLGVTESIVINNYEFHNTASTGSNDVRGVDLYKYRDYSHYGVPEMIDFGYLYNKFSDDSFLDFSPYTKITLYMPYLGTVEIDPMDVAGEKIVNLKYAFDPYTGDATGFLFGGNSDNIIATKSAKLGYEIPIVQGRESQATVNVVTSALTTAASVATSIVTKAPTPAILGTLAGGASGIVGALNTSNERAGQLTAGTSFYAPQKAFFIVQKQVSALPADPSIFNATVGRACCKTGTLSSFHGFTKCSAFHLDGFLNALDSELEEIDSLLRSGIILPASE